MAYEQRPNSGTLFRVPEDKKTSDKSKDYDGEFVLVCPHCQAESRGWLGGWVKTAAKTGAKFLSVSFKFRERQPVDTRVTTDRSTPQKPAAPAARPAYGEDDREIPF
jgi:hypothetical protein